jgi:N-acetylmuramoyl-L-alanine amidase
MVREVAAVTSGRRSLGHLRIVIGEFGGLGALARQVTTALRQHSASATVVGHPDASTHADIANRYRADLYLGFEAAPEKISRIQYYAVQGFESAAGRSLGEQLANDVRQPFRASEIELIGNRLPILRETRMPAILWQLGPTAEIISHTPTLVRGVVVAIEGWAQTRSE